MPQAGAQIMTTTVVEELQQQSRQLDEEFKGFGEDPIVTCVELDPQEYYRRKKDKKAHKKQKYGKFIKFAKIDLSSYHIWDDELNNAAVRDEQNKDHADEDIAYSLKTEGWLYDSFPPIISTDGKIKDGRTRIRAALIAEWDHILVAIFSYDETGVAEEFSSITNGLIANKHVTARTASMADFVKGGVELVRLGQLEREYSSIEEWLINDVEIGNFFDVAAGIHTKIRNRIYDQSAAPSKIIIDKDREEWIEYIVQSPEFKELGIEAPDTPTPFGENKLIVYSASRTNARRCFCDPILGNQSKDMTGCKHTYIVLFSNADTEEKVRESVKNFCDDLNTFYVQSVNMVNGLINGINIEVPNERSYTIIGVVPLFNTNETHKTLRSLNRLVPLDKL
jgi:hypothetical protein